MAGDYFALQAFIMERIRQTNIEGLGMVHSARDLELLKDGRVADGAVYVLYDGESIPDGDDYQAGPFQIVRQYWLVVLVTKNYATPAQGDRERAGPLLWSINERLQGWVPAPGYGELTKSSPPRPSYLEKNAFYPLRYVSAITTKGCNS
ncbi:hypothetical protein SIID45300_01060 [Candidatus Magnetaquicoccaceae bacterium FCR-1]|uniref:Uncharacterized protein n=1 Tax=Candidatus Magnetaquiglobus chichijimensis TaxID=3141448 RepID=A0ABQ0C792_9PROT